MRKVISLMMVLVLGVVVMGAPAYAECPGPNAVTAAMTDGSPTPSGDDGGWNDVDAVGSGYTFVLRPLLYWMSAFLVKEIYVQDSPTKNLKPERTNVKRQDPSKS